MPLEKSTFWGAVPDALVAAKGWWADGVSGKEIAKRLADRFAVVAMENCVSLPTRNAVIGKMGRTGTITPNKGANVGGGRSRKTRNPHPHFGSSLEDLLDAAEATEHAIKTARRPKTVYRRWVALVDLEPGQCRYMHDGRYCGGQGEPWCPVHREVVYQPRRKV